MWISCCQRERVAPDESPRNNAIVDELTFRTIYGGTQLRSAEWYTYARTVKPLGRLVGWRPIEGGAFPAPGDVRTTTLLTSGEAVSAKQKAPLPRLRTRDRSHDENDGSGRRRLGRPEDEAFERKLREANFSRRNQLHHPVRLRQKSQLPEASNDHSTTAEIVAESLHAALCRRTGHEDAPVSSSTCVN